MDVVLHVDKFKKILFLNQNQKVNLFNSIIIKQNLIDILDEPLIPMKQEELPTTMSIPSQSQSSPIIHFANVNTIK
jgi:hypothetical protein